MQNPRVALRDAELRDCEPALDKLGMPIVAAGNFAYAFKLRDTTNRRATAVRCFRGYIPDRDKRYSMIDAHLNAHPNPRLASFEFDPDGILIAGRRYPIVSMEWIDGPTLDLYVEQILGNKAALTHLADEWLKVIGSLRDAQVAHGDLQHGNLIIQNSQFRLIDLDGMFVPAMRGFNNNENGHPHYQHPDRSFKDFNLALDNFSSLVVYLSLLALGEAPELWRDFHDENLIFLRSDFVNPDSSKLLARLRKMAQPIPQLTDTLARAAKARPADAPYLLDLATQKSKLPAWMTAPANIRIEVRTREAGTVPSNGNAVSVQPQFTPTRKQPSAPPSLSQTTATGSVSTSAPPASIATTVFRNVEWGRIHKRALRNAIKCGFWGLVLFWIWVPFLQGLGHSLGVAKEDSSTFVFWMYVLSCVIIGYVYSWKAEKKRIASPLGTIAPAPAWKPPAPAPWTYPSYGTSGANTRRPSASSATQVIGSKIRSIYHRPNCEWVTKMSYRNRVTFNSVSAAAARGYRPCQVCRP
jgi:hypothetical protein